MYSMPQEHKKGKLFTLPFMFLQTSFFIEGRPYDTPWCRTLGKFLLQFWYPFAVFVSFGFLISTCFLHLTQYPLVAMKFLSYNLTIHYLVVGLAFLNMLEHQDH